MFQFCIIAVFAACISLDGIFGQSCDPCFIQAPTSRRSCGSHKRDECGVQDCCFKKSKKVPWCYLKEVDDPCNVHPVDRVPCSEDNEGDCLDAGCCWDPTDLSPSRRCYTKKDISGSTLPDGPITGLDCNIPPEFRQNCGWRGITKEQCECRGCCFNNTIKKTIWCYYSASND